ncbi:MAG: hypothetical protein KF892_10185 [Rhizobacter sp.]|nr:hypothetical protein [Rhizobacter sp.]
MRFLFLLISLLVALPAPAATEGKDSVSFADTRRAYTRLPGEFDIRYETEMAVADPKLTEGATRKLTATLREIIDTLPPHTRSEFRSTTYFLMWGAKSPQGGLKSGMRYVTRGSKNPLHDPRWQGAVVIYSAHNFLHLDEVWSKKALTHEMAHAWHLLNRKPKDPAILGPFDNAIARGLYRDVQDHKGQIVADAYARTNQLEYFAELSAAYFVGINYMPFDRKGLRSYDPIGYQMVETLWGLR